MNSMNASNSDLALALNAWLSDELPPDEAVALGVRVANDAALGAEAATIRKTDALLREWYANLEVPAQQPVAKPPLLSRHGWLTALAATAALALLIVPALRPQTRTRAEEALDRTAERVRNAQGILARYDIEIVKFLEQPNEKGARDERRKGSGEIKLGRLGAPRLAFHCTEHWQQFGNEPTMNKTWGESGRGKWERIIVETDGAVVKSEAANELEFSGREEPMDDLGGDIATGSPADMRTRRGIEGLAALIRSFGRGNYLRWMGLTWQAEGGKGTAAEPWVYGVEVTSELAESEEKRPRMLWTLNLTYDEVLGVLSRVTVEEKVLDANDKLQSLIRTDYHLEFKSEAWPQETFASEGMLKEQD